MEKGKPGAFKRRTASLRNARIFGLSFPVVRQVGAAELARLEQAVKTEGLRAELARLDHAMNGGLA